MEKKFLYFQPEYVKEFKCDSNTCPARCCKNWRIFVDKKTYKQYQNIKPKTAAKEITQHILFDKKTGQYLINNRESDETKCPMLADDNRCIIQRDYGEEFLSEVCSTYPRKTYGFGDFFERSLTLTCPLVASMVLMRDTPLSFEWTEVNAKTHSYGGKNTVIKVNLSNNFSKIVVNSQITAVSILQERRLTIDQRLVVLGFFLDKLDEMLTEQKFDKLDNLFDYYKSKKFFSEQVSHILESFDFNLKAYIKTILEIFEKIYGKESPFCNFADSEKNFMNGVIETLGLYPDENHKVSLDKVVANYDNINDLRKKFVNHFSTVFENYLVNEFFFHLQPFENNHSTIQNYGVFVFNYKITELFAFSAALGKFRRGGNTEDNLVSKTQLVSYIMFAAELLDHRTIHLNIAEDIFKNKNTFQIMETFLQP